MGKWNLSRMLNMLPDEAFLKLKYRIRLGKRPDLKNPQTFNEKLQWLKLHDRREIYTRMVDKYAVKELVEERIGPEYVIPTLGVWDSFDQIPFDTLPDQFVLKCTHDSGGLVICRDKQTLDKEAARIKIEKSLKRNYYYQNREWPYKNVKPRILAEALISDRDHKDLPVYKIFCFHGVPKLIQMVQNDKQPEESIDYFDGQWNRLDLRQNYPNSRVPMTKPDCLEEMLEIAAKLAGDREFIRVDLFLSNGNIYFSEYTFYSDAGFSRFHPDSWDAELGRWIQLNRN